MSLKYKLILGGMAALLIPLFIAGLIIYLQLSGSLLEITKEKSVNIVKDISAIISRGLEQEMQLASVIASDPDILAAIKAGDFNVALYHLQAIHRRIGDPTYTIFVTDKSGLVRADALWAEQVGLDLSDRDYFIKARQGNPSVSGPLLPRGTATPGNPILVIAAPIQDEGGFYGIVTLAHDTEFLTKIIARKKMGKTGYSYLINEQGLILIHPNKGYILKKNILDKPGAEGLKKLIRAEKTGTVTYSNNGSEEIVGLTRVDLTGWIAVFSESVNEVMAPVNKILYSIFIVGILFTAATIILIYFLSSKVSDPIQKTMEMMNEVTRHSSEIILQIGIDRRIIFANPAFEKITGLKTGELGKTELDLTNPKNIPAGVIWDSLETGNPWFGRLIFKGGKRESTTLEVMLLPIKDVRGSIRSYLMLGRDITAELMFEKRTQQAQKLEAVGTLAGGIAHDFNNILGGILGYAELSLLKVDSPEDTEKYIKQIISASERARDLVAQILAFSRKSEVELRPLAPGAILKEAAKLLRASTPASIDIRLNLDSDSIIMAEPTQIHQIVMNLVTNAVHAIGENPGTIKLDLEDFMVDEEFTGTHPNIEPGKHIILRISDTGNGIDPEILDNIFEPFVTTKDYGEGSGLGLSVVHGIVKNLNGIITVYSKVGDGTVFNVIVPAVEPNQASAFQEDLSIRKGSERIVIIDDEPAIATTIQSILTNLGYKVEAFTEGREALTAIKAAPDDFDLIISDYSMPRITGLEIVKELKEAGVSIPSILTSGYLDQKLEAAAAKAGVSKVILKPINTYRLTEAIQSVLERLP